jgi:hypothetical protein
MRNDKPGTISYRADFRIGKFSISSLIPGDRLAEVLLNTAQYVDGMPRKCQRGVVRYGQVGLIGAFSRQDPGTYPPSDDRARKLRRS